MKIALSLTIAIAVTALAHAWLEAQPVAPQRPSLAHEQENYRRAADYSRQFRGLSVLVMKGGTVVFEAYQNGHTADTPHPLASGTKSFNGVMAAAAVEDGLLRWDEKVSDTLSEWKTDARKSQITIRQLLSLSSGIEVGTLGRPPSYVAAVEAKSKFEPGTTFEYGPMSFQVWGEVMRRKLAAKNETPLDYLKRRILQPIGLNISLWTHQSGQPNLSAGASLTAREWAKFGRFLLQGGRWNGKQIVAKEQLEECFAGSAANPNYGLTFWLNRSFDGRANVAPAQAEGRRMRERLGLEAETTRISEKGVGAQFPHDLIMAAGAGKQRLYVIPSLDLVVVRQGQQSSFEDAEFLSRLLR